MRTAHIAMMENRLQGNSANSMLFPAIVLATVRDVLPNGRMRKLCPYSTLLSLSLSQGSSRLQNPSGKIYNSENTSGRVVAVVILSGEKHTLLTIQGSPVRKFRPALHVCKPDKKTREEIILVK